jgi:two-component system, chemotaxis family, response regulator Rcp1
MIIDEPTLGRTAIILLVEDNQNDVKLTRLSFEKARMKVDLHVVEDGEECMAFLRKKGQFTSAPTPDLILLDLNLPGMDGREVLAEISGDEVLRHFPVVILTTSRNEEEILKMYQLRCSSYIVKPIDLEQFLRVVRTITEYWFTVVVLPAEQVEAAGRS